MCCVVNYNYSRIDEYLTEKLLGDFLFEFLSECEIISDKCVPNSGIKNRPDYRIDEINLIIEFNGKHHYTSPRAILSDYKKKMTYERMGYTVKTIPYWIQLKSEVIGFLFEDSITDLNLLKLKDYNLYPIGFVSKDCPLPSTFCDLGLRKLNEEYKLWDSIIDKLYRYFDFSLIEKILECDSFLSVSNETVLPYFVDLWKNRGHGYELKIDTDMFPGINNELKILESLK